MEGEIQAQIRHWYTQWHKVDRLYAQFARTQGITPTALFALRLVAGHPKGCAQSELVRQMDQPKQTISHLLATLEQKRWIARQPLAGDKRNEQVRLTAEGRAFTEQMVEELNQWEAGAFSSLTSEERESFTRINERLTEALRRGLKEGGESDGGEN